MTIGTINIPPPFGGVQGLQAGGVTAFLDSVVNGNYSVAVQMAIDPAVSVKFDPLARSDGFRYCIHYWREKPKKEPPYYVVDFNIDMPAEVQTPEGSQKWVFDLIPTFSRFVGKFKNHAIQKEAVIQTKLSPEFCDRLPVIVDKIVKKTDSFIDGAYEGRLDKDSCGIFINNACEVSTLIILSDADDSAFHIMHEMSSFLREACNSIYCINSKITSVSSAVHNVVGPLKKLRRARLDFTRGTDHKGNFKDAAARVQFEIELRRLILSVIASSSVAGERQIIEIAIEDNAAGETVVKVGSNEMIIPKTESDKFD